MPIPQKELSEQIGVEQDNIATHDSIALADGMSPAGDDVVDNEENTDESVDGGTKEHSNSTREKSTDNLRDHESFQTSVEETEPSITDAAVSETRLDVNTSSGQSSEMQGGKTGEEAAMRTRLTFDVFSIQHCCWTRGYPS